MNDDIEETFNSVDWNQYGSASATQTNKTDEIETYAYTLFFIAVCALVYFYVQM